jgi:SAM-dependent methyltransferase
VGDEQVADGTAGDATAGDETAGDMTVSDEAVIGRQIPAGPTGAPAVPGVWVAGNVADVRAQVLPAAAAGLTAAAAINADLVAEATDAAVDHYRHRARTMFDAAAWEERYQAKPALWSGRPNPQLVTEVAGLTPGRALDVGCGEGADAIWLAERGWRVTAVDISRTALDRAATHAEATGEAVAGRIDWRQADLRQADLRQADLRVDSADPGEVLEPGGYNLVSAQFMQVPSDVRRVLFARLARAVAPGGTLLIVGHHPSDLRTSAHRMHFPDMMYTGEEVAADLDPGHWDIRAAETRPRSTMDSEGRSVSIHDAVLLARRRGEPA